MKNTDITIEEKVKEFRKKFGIIARRKEWDMSVEEWVSQALAEAEKKGRVQALGEVENSLKSSITVAGLPAKACSKWEICKKEISNLKDKQ